MRQRLDHRLVAAGLAEDGSRAQSLIAAGMVEVDGRLATSAAQLVEPKSQLRIVGRRPWASRGGEKLAAALDHYEVEVAGRVALDAGASTGGFTDVLLQRGARVVYAADVGRGLLLPRLAQDPRVISLDETNIRTLTSLPGEPADFVVADVSFISLRQVIPAFVRVAPGSEVIPLFKPQFEVPREDVPAGGVVRDESVVGRGLEELSQWLRQHGVGELHPPVPAAVRGRKGNQEFFLHLRLPEAWP